MFTLLEAMRNRLAWLVLVMLVGCLGAAEFLGSIAITESLQIKSATLGAMLRLSSVFVVALFVTTSMARELNDKGLEMVLSLPITRASYFAGKLLGFSLASVVMAILVGGALMIYVPPIQAGLWAVSLGCELLIVSAVSLACLLTLHHVTVALSAVTAFYFLSRSINAIQLMGQGPLTDTTSSSQWAIARLVDAIAFVLPSLDKFTAGEWLVYYTGRMEDLLPILGQTAIYLVLLTGVGLFDLYRKDL